MCCNNILVSHAENKFTPRGRHKKIFTVKSMNHCLIEFAEDSINIQIKNNMQKNKNCL